MSLHGNARDIFENRMIILYALKEVDPICSLKMWDWIKNNGMLEVNTM